MSKNLLSSALLLVLCTTAFATQTSLVTVTDKVQYLPTKQAWEAKGIFTQPGTYHATCKFDTATNPLKDGQSITVSYTRTGGVDPTPPPTAPPAKFDAQHVTISIAPVLVTKKSLDPGTNMYTVFYNYTTTGDFGLIPATCTYTLISNKYN